MSLLTLSLCYSDAPCGAVMLMHAFLFKILFISGRLNRHREFLGRYVKCERNTRLFSLVNRTFLNQSNVISGENIVLI